MFSKSRQLLLGSFTRKFLDTKGKTVKCLNLTPFSTTSTFGNKNEPNHDYRKELNIYRTFTAKLRPDLVEESEKFNALYPEIKGEITSYVEKVTNKRAAEHVNKVFDYNVPGGKQFRVMQIIMGYKHLMDKSEQTPEKMRQVYIISWALELATSIMVVHDDMIDGAVIRRNAPCWHTLEDIGPFAVVDYIQVIHSAYYILKSHCRHLPAYPRLFESICQGVHLTMIGQTMDHHSPSVADFSTEFMRKASHNIVSDFLFYTPLSMVMALAGYESAASIQSICYEMGHYHQCQNDILDVFNIDGMLLKPGHDIEIGKLSWLSSTCMERANDAQKRIMIDNYGQKDPKCIERVKQLYLDMDMHQVYEDFAYERYDSIKMMIKEASCDDPMKELLYQILDLLFHRTTIKSN